MEALIDANRAIFTNIWSCLYILHVNILFELAMPHVSLYLLFHTDIITRQVPIIRVNSICMLRTLIDK